MTSTSPVAPAPLASGPYLLDTNVLIFYCRGGAVGREIENTYQLRTSPVRPFVCVVTLGEAHAFARKPACGPAKLTRLDQLLRELVAVDISDPRVIRGYAEIDHFSESRGRSMGKNDVWIASAAHATGATLITTDRDFDHLAGVYLTRVLIDPATGSTL